MGPGNKNIAKNQSRFQYFPKMYSVLKVHVKEFDTGTGIGL
jgi:hypothetical protein